MHFTSKILKKLAITICLALVITMLPLSEAKAEVSSIAIAKDGGAIQLTTGQTAQFQTPSTIAYEGDSYTVTSYQFSADDTDAVSVDANGKVTALKAGYGEITVDVYVQQPVWNNDNYGGDFDDYYDETIYNGDTAYAIIDSNGHIVSSSKGKSVYTTGENIYSNLSTGNLPTLSLAQIKIRVVKGEKMAFKASNSEENREIAIAPFGIADWSLVTVINSDYVEKLVDDDTREARSLVNNIVILICIFVALLLVYVVINKIRFNEESADLADKADTDLLTGLNNKIATERKIQEYLDENPGVQCMMFLFDIDNFKKVNDTMGHAFGDELLKNLGHQLTNEFRVTDIIGRLGGDEFVVFLKNIKSDEQLSREGVRITTFFHHFKVGGYVQYSATASIGAVILPKDATTFEEAYKAADKALYEAKRRGKNQLVYYSREISDIESVRVTGDIESDKR